MLTNVTGWKHKSSKSRLYCSFFFLSGLVSSGKQQKLKRRNWTPLLQIKSKPLQRWCPTSVSCSTCDEEQDDVFLDPSHHRVKRPPANLASHPEEGVGGVRTSWSPLLGDQLDAMCQEAKRLADQLQCGKWPHGKDEGAAPATAAPASASLAQQDVEHFIQDGAAKLGVLASPPSLSSPVKRQTFLVQDSPMKDLPPAIRNHMQRGSAAAHLGASAAPATRLSTRLATSSPAAGGKTRAALRGKTGLGAILPSKPAAPRTSSSASKGIAAQKVQVPKHGKVASGCKPNQSSDLASRTKSCEDILSDSASVVSDVSDSSLNSSIAGKKRTLAPPTKVVVRQSGVKATPLQSGKTTERRNTSSSSSSVSSFNSSLSLSPATGKLNSVNRGVSPSNGPVVSGNGSRPVNPNKRRSGVGGVTRTVASSPSPSSSSVAASRRRSGTLTGQARKLSEPAKAARTTPQHQTTPAKRTLDKTSLTTASAWIQSGLKTKSKFAAVGQTPIPSEGAAGQGFCSPDVSMVLKPKRLLSVASMDRGKQASAFMFPASFRSPHTAQTPGVGHPHADVRQPRQDLRTLQNAGRLGLRLPHQDLPESHPHRF
ncbi:G2 and S phase-expressed protein 1 isoform X3 [Phyllopteryx taeniolatus]|uniref:G2 and S phase-expressed protein 1 isoform X3 n=1 Tax=Phyllopteryx taeniolatus TaxID=161469 RepID=UPI002AD5090A|nr:G2 and S phase-expressed protein 1 isoform X3 [Phyllopteryx taeniolatus]